MTPGYKTSEFWLAAAGQSLAGTAATGVLNTPGNPGWVQLAGLVLSTALPLLYAWVRAKLKMNTSESVADPDIAGKAVREAMQQKLNEFDEKFKKMSTPVKPNLL